MKEPKKEFWPAPAKLNLFLHVTGRRPDGYHTLQTIFQLIDLADEVGIRATHGSDIIRESGDYGVPQADDLVVRAARLLQTECRVKKGARITVRKKIPLGAGLGGGSSDAATVLLALNRLWKCHLSVEQLAELGLRLGADVPVFVKGHSAFASGVGEKLEAVELGSRHYVLVLNELKISTALVFQQAELKRDSTPVTAKEALLENYRNDCEPVVCRLFPEFKKLLRELEKWGTPHMTGTGSCIFLPMPDKKAAMSAAEQMKCRYNVRAVRGLDRSPMHEILGLSAHSTQ